MKALVTGASGFLGSAVARTLMNAGWQVRVLVRENSDRRNLEGLDVEICQGDLLDHASFTPVLTGCDGLFHVAADYRLWVPDPERMYAINVDGTRALMQAAIQAGVSRVVYTSSVATLGLNKDGSPANEDTPVTVDDMIGPYKRSKFLAEEVVQTMVDHEGLPAVIVNPSTPVGPRDIKPTPTGEMVSDAATGRMPAYVDTGLNIVHVDDVAAGHLTAYEKGQTGRRYILGGENMMLQDIFAQIAKLTGQKAPSIQLPHNLILPIAYLMEIWSRVTKLGKPRVTVDGVRLSKKKMFFSSERAETELGYSYRPVEEAFREAIEWFQQNSKTQQC